MKKIFIGLLLLMNFAYGSNFTDQKIFLLVSQAELNTVLESRLSNEIVEDIHIDYKMFDGFPVKVYSNNNNNIAILFSEKNLKTMIEKSSAMGYLKCMKENDLDTKEVSIDYRRYNEELN